MRADAMFHRALVRELPERDDPGGDARRRPRARADPRRYSRRAWRTTGRRSTSTGASSPRCAAATRTALDEVLDEHFRMLETQFAKAIGRRWSELFGARATARALS